ncbi:hypothetical protein [Kitasatospora sp. SUK 42]|uniref:DUF7919 family protein n=1 Tax=Kitasatospora sp. SUK 42 TaxID=1588882 RepID=UPI0018CA9190|nr:hypothetical protein [Kitasatospora sp. SUK 42]MBV2154883.1 hypothetical protein [Kitasatospora sp. SUK 42]
MSERIRSKGASMTYYGDGTDYEYLSPDMRDIPVQWKREINIGWLDRHFDFPTGEPLPELAEALRWLVSTRAVNRTRGCHPCYFCKTADVEIPNAAIPGKTVYLGMAEIRVGAAEGVAYAAPTLISHYVEEHGYLPPLAFQEAAVAEYRELAGNAGAL